MWANNFGIAYQRFDQSVATISSINTSGNNTNWCRVCKRTNCKYMGKFTSSIYWISSNGRHRKKGVDSGFEGLFKNAKWIITPTQNSDLNSVRTISELIKSMHCEICQASPKEHDEAVSLISHLPIFLASALIETATNKNNLILY